MNRLDAHDLMLLHDGEVPASDQQHGSMLVASDPEAQRLLDGWENAGEALRGWAEIQGRKADGLADHVMARIEPKPALISTRSGSPFRVVERFPPGRGPSRVRPRPGEDLRPRVTGAPCLGLAEFRNSERCSRAAAFSESARPCANRESRGKAQWRRLERRSEASIRWDREVDRLLPRAACGGGPANQEARLGDEASNSPIWSHPAQRREWLGLRPGVVGAAISGAFALAAVLALTMGRATDPRPERISTGAAEAVALSAVLPSAAPRSEARIGNGLDSSATIELVDFGTKNGTIFLVYAETGEKTPVVWLADEPMPGENRTKKL